MIRLYRPFLSTLTSTLCGLTVVLSDASTVHSQGQAELHAEGTIAKDTVAKPRIFLDKSPRIVEYQLKRLTNAQLLLVDRGTDDAKYAPVHTEILIRPGMPSSERQQAADALATIRKSQFSAELLGVLPLLKTDHESQRIARELSQLLLAQAPATLQQQLQLFTDKVQSSSGVQRRVALAALISAGQAELAQRLTSKDVSGQVDFIAAIPWVQAPSQRNKLREWVIAELDDKSPSILRQTAVETLASLTVELTDTFRRVAELVGQAELSDVAVRTLASIPTSDRPAATCQPLALRLLEIAEATPAADRTSDRFVDLSQLFDSLLSNVPAEIAKAYRQRMREISVRLIRIRTVEDEMRYDIKFFAVEAGRPVQLLLLNNDLMPHNLVITQPGFLKEVALQAAMMAPDQATDGKQYVPKSDKVLFASSMISAGKSERMTFNAPQAPDEYPFVCTFPNHWMRMYGVMVVVADLDTWQQTGQPPVDPIGNNRSFVKNWKTEDLLSELSIGMRGRDPKIGARIFQEATCAQCHKFRGAGGLVGPDLSDLVARWKGDQAAVLREILDPSHRIEPKYAVHSVLTESGKVYSGVVVAEDANFVSLMNSPEQKTPAKIPRKEIEEMLKSPKSLMPSALMDHFTKDEIFELLAYLHDTTSSQR